MRMWIVLAAMAIASPADAQFGGVLDKAQKALEQKQKLDDLNVSEAEEIDIGADVSLKIRQRFGVVQDAAIHRYVALVGMLLAQQTERPGLPWTFVVLDTDGVNAFASPGGFVHITRGALALIRSEAELAGVLGHEMTHVAHKHTVNAIKKNKAVQLATSETLAERGAFIDRLANKAYEMVLENSFDRGDEIDADAGAVALVRKLGYAPRGLADFLTRLDERNRGQGEQNGLFASHPQTADRIARVNKVAGAAGALVAARYVATVQYKPTDITKVAVVTEGKDTKAANQAAQKPAEPKSGGIGLGALRQTIAPEKQSGQVSASGGARGVGPDRLARGGDNPTLVKVTISAADLAGFRKGIS